MASETDQIREQIAETRQHLKLHMTNLEERVIGSVKSGLERVSPAHQFNEHPIVFAVGSVAVGIAAGRIVGGVFTPRNDRARLVRQPSGPPSSEWKALKGIATSAFIQLAGEIAKSVFPKHEGVVHQIVSDFRTKLEEEH
jgi:hypothetical protein